VDYSLQTFLNIFYKFMYVICIIIYLYIILYLYIIIKNQLTKINAVFTAVFKHDL
jgi:hypothetical protein